MTPDLLYTILYTLTPLLTGALIVFFLYAVAKLFP